MAVAPTPPRTRQPLNFEFVAVASNLQVMRHEVTIAQWQLCVSEGGCSFMPKPGPGAHDKAFPVTGIGALDAHEFALWASNRTGQSLRLPTRDEWYYFSEVPAYNPEKLFTDPRLAWAATYGSESQVDPILKRQDGFGQSSKGIADVKGNVWEWTSSCVMGDNRARCPAYFAAGNHEAKISVFVRDPSSGGCATGNPPTHLGLRLVR
jgi:formylglycine-generating enzyme required for sulfatase activity